MEPIKKYERGQTIVLIALSMVGLLGFTALAVDGGMALNDRRRAQGAADAASLAGARVAATSLEAAGFAYDTNFDNCNDPPMELIEAAIQEAKDTAVTRAGSNTFTIDQDLTDNNGVDAMYDCQDYGTWADKYIDVTTRVTRNVPTSFVQIFLPGGFTNSVASVTRLRPRTLFYYGNAVVALREDCDGPGENKGGVIFGGSNDTEITGGGVYSNACMQINGSPDISAPSFTYRIEPAPVPAPPNTYYQPGSPAMPPFDVDPVECNAADMPLNPGTDKDTENHDVTIYHPGRYTNTISSHGNYDSLRQKGTKLRFEPGLYCLANWVNFSGGFIEGNGVTFYLTGGSFQTSGNAEIQLSAPTDQNQTMHSIVGMLVYLPEGQTEPVKLTGNAGSYYIGLVYAPSATCEIAGTTSGIHDFNSQVVCGTVKITGNASIKVNFNKSNSILADPKMEQNK